LREVGHSVVGISKMEGFEKKIGHGFWGPVSLTVPVSIGCGYREQYHGLLNFEMLRHILYQTVWIIKRLQQMFN